MGIISVVVLLLIADFNKVWLAILDFKMIHILVLCGMQMVTIGLINVQWQKIAHAMGEKVSFSKILEMNMTGTFVECITPAVKAGGEFAKVVMLKNKLGFSAGKATAIVGFQKVVSMTAFLFLNVLSLSWFLMIQRGNIHMSVIIISFVVISLLSFLLLISVFNYGHIEKLLYKLPFIKKKDKVSEFSIQFQETINIVKERKSIFIKQWVLSLIIWLFFAIKAFYIVWVMNLQIGFITISVITYLTYMVGMLPLLPGGLGTFEGSLMMLLLPFGATMDQGMTVAFVLRFVTFWFVFLLSAIYLGCGLIPQRKGKENFNGVKKTYT